MLKKVVQNSILYSSVSILLRASSIIFFPIFSAYLTKADYGILSITQGIIVIITSFSGLELHRALTRFLNTPEAKADEHYKGSLAGTILTSNFLVTMLVVGICLIFGKFLFKGLLNDISFYPYMFYSLLGVITNVAVGFFRIFLKALHQGKHSFFYEIGFFATNIGLNLLFVVVFKMDVIGIIYSTLISGFIFTFYALYRLKSTLRLSVNLQVWKQVFNYSGPLIPFIFFGLLLTNVDKFILNSKNGVDESGLYYIAFTFAGIFATIKESVVSAVTPWFFEFYESNKEQAKKFVFHVLWLGAILAFLVSVFSYEVLFVLSSNPELVGAWKYIPLLTVGYYIVFIGQIYNLPVYQAINKNKFLTLGNFGGFIVTLILGLLLVAKYNIHGATFAKTMGYLMMTAIFIVISAKTTSFRLNLSALFLILLIFLPLMFMQYIPLPYLSVLGLKLVVSIVAIIIYLRVLIKNYKEVENKWGLLKSKFTIK